MAHRNGAPVATSSRSSVSSPSPVTPSVVVDDADLGGVQRLRSAALIAPETVPAPPVGAVPVDVAERVSQLSRVAGSNVSELVDALDHVAENPAVCAGSPNTSERAARIADRIRTSMETESRLVDALAVTRQQRAIAVSDGHKLVVDIADDVRHGAKRDPAITQRHAPVVSYAALPAEAVKKGLARTRAAKAKAAKKAQRPNGEKPEG